MKHHEEPFAEPLDEARIDSLGHIVRTAYLAEGEEGYNPRIEVFREPERGQIYQMWAVSKFASNNTVFDAVEAFHLAGTDPNKETWTNLLEHSAGVAAIADHLSSLLEQYGAPLTSSNTHAITAATLVENLAKPEAIEAGIEMAALMHDLQKPAEIAIGSGGLENSRDNPVLREGRLWQYLHGHGVSDEVILMAQNTGRNDRFFSDLEDYDEGSVKKALEDREALAQLLGVDRDVVDAMTPTERRRASIEAKGVAAAIVGISDALAAQFKFQGITDERIDATAAYYLSYKTDPESVAFFGRDWPEYYKEVRRYLVDQVPAENRAAFEQALNQVTHERIFNETVLPAVLGSSAAAQQSALRYPDP